MLLTLTVKFLLPFGQMVSKLGLMPKLKVAALEFILKLLLDTSKKILSEHLTIILAVVVLTFGKRIT